MNRLSNLKIGYLFKHYIWIILGIVALCIRYVAGITPQYVEQFYSRGIYPGIRWFFDHSIGLLPFPLLYVFYGLIFYFLYKLIRLIFNKKMTIKNRFTETIFSLSSFAGFMVFWFLFLWGFNYARPSFSQQISLTIHKPDSLALFNELKTAASEAIDARTKVTNSPLSNAQLPDDFENLTRREVTRFLESNGFKAGGSLRGRSINPDGILNRFGISGIYMPYVGEANIDDGLHDLEKPYDLAHEMAHGYGWTEEATANFIAYLSCIQSDNAFVRYSGLLNHYRYVASNCKRLNTEGYQLFRDNLPEGIKADLDAINERQKKYPSWLETDWMNDIFLRSQGVKEGVASYSKVVVLVYSWRKKKEPIER
jgi:Protein of unknown function (DUF3810)